MVLRLFIWRITSIPLVMFLGVNEKSFKFIPCKRREVRHRRAIATKTLQRHPSRRRQVRHCVLLQYKSSAASLAAAIGPTPACSANIMLSEASLSGDRSETCVYLQSDSSASSLAAATGPTICPCLRAATTAQRTQSRQRPHRRNIRHVVRDKPNLRHHAFSILGVPFPSAPSPSHQTPDSTPSASC